MKHKVWIVTYCHRNGTDTQVFATEAEAESCRRNIAAENWDSEIDENADSAPKPSDPDELADTYFEIMGRRDADFESLEIECQELNFPE